MVQFSNNPVVKQEQEITPAVLPKAEAPLTASNEVVSPQAANKLNQIGKEKLEELNSQFSEHIEKMKENLETLKENLKKFGSLNTKETTMAREQIGEMESSLKYVSKLQNCLETGIKPGASVEEGEKFKKIVQNCDDAMTKAVSHSMVASEKADNWVASAAEKCHIDIA